MTEHQDLPESAHAPLPSWAVALPCLLIVALEGWLLWRHCRSTWQEMLRRLRGKP